MASHKQESNPSPSRIYFSLILSPLPQLPPHLDKSLHLLRSWNAIVDEPAILVRLLVILSHGRHAQMRKAVAKVPQVFLAQHSRFAPVGTACHCDDDATIFALYSLQ